MKRRTMLLLATGAVVALAAVAVAIAQGQPPLQPICVWFGPDIKCTGCNDAADTCTCLAGSFCKTSHQVCYTRPVTATDAGMAPCSNKYTRPYGACARRYECVNGNGHDGGVCSQPGDCETNPAGWTDILYPQQRYYKKTSVCDPDNCVT